MLGNECFDVMKFQEKNENVINHMLGGNLGWIGRHVGRDGKRNKIFKIEKNIFQNINQPIPILAETHGQRTLCNHGE